MAQLVKCLLYTSMIAWVQVLGTTHGKSQAWGFPVCSPSSRERDRRIPGSRCQQLSRISELRVQREIVSKIQVANSGGGHLTNVKLWLLHTYAYVHYHMYTHTPHCTPHTPPQSPDSLVGPGYLNVSTCAVAWSSWKAVFMDPSCRVW